MSTRLCFASAGIYSGRLSGFCNASTSDLFLRSAASKQFQHKAAAKLCDSRTGSLSGVKRPSLFRALATQANQAGSPQPHFTEWSGLQSWRQSEVDNRRVWGQKGPTALVSQVLTHCSAKHNIYGGQKVHGASLQEIQTARDTQLSCGPTLAACATQARLAKAAEPALLQGVLK